MSSQLLMEAGVDSLAAVELSNAVSTHFSLEVPATLTFDYPTIAAMAAFLAPQTGHAQRSITTVDPQSSLLVPSNGLLSGRRTGDLTSIVGVACRCPQGLASGRAVLSTDKQKYQKRCCSLHVSYSMIEITAFCMLRMSEGRGDVQKLRVWYTAGDGSMSGAAGFWGTMMGAGDVQRVVPAARWDMDAVYSPDILPGKMSINVRSA